jgi:hypothetical protein
VFRYFSSRNGLCNALASSHGARFQTSHSHASSGPPAWTSGGSAGPPRSAQLSGSRRRDAVRGSASTWCPGRLGIRSRGRRARIAVGHRSARTRRRPSSSSRDSAPARIPQSCWPGPSNGLLVSTIPQRGNVVLRIFVTGGPPVRDGGGRLLTPSGLAAFSLYLARRSDKISPLGQKLEAALKCRSYKKGRHAPPVHVIKLTGDHAVCLVPSRR